MRKFSLSLVLSLLVALFVPTAVGYASPSQPSDSRLSPYGDQTMQDLASCLRTAKYLDVYYLIDNSKSLGPDKASRSNGNDPGFMRADIVGQDIVRWSDMLKIQTNLSIRVAGSFFANSASPLSGWQQLSSSNASQVASSFKAKIRAKKLDNYTNWTAGLTAAYDSLDASTADCKALVWFTDGGLWSSSPRAASLDDLTVLCGSGNGQKRLSADGSQQGLMARIRAAQIHVFGIMLSPNGANASSEKDEDYYKSLMPPLIEETGPPISGSGSLPSGNLVCGENLPASQRKYATGAYLKATSAAQIAYNFLLLNSKVAGGTASNGDKSGKFWIDPGIKSFEILTSAKNWQILDDKGKKIQSSSDSSYLGTTGRIQVPNLKQAGHWRFIGDAPYTVVVYPELYLDLHNNAIFSGRKNKITGQFVTNLTTKTPANLSLFKKTAISAIGNDSALKSSITSSGVFQIDDYTPKAGEQALDLKVSLVLSTEHYSELAPLNFELAQPIRQSSSLPAVSKIQFWGKLVGSKNSASARFTVSAPKSGQSGSVCFKTPQVMADNQDQSAGKTTDRSSTWAKTFTGLDKNGCVSVGGGQAKFVTSRIGNKVQADSSLQLLYDYGLSASDGSVIRDSQSVTLDTARNAQSGLFWLWFLSLSLLSLLIPYLVLYVISAPAARIYSTIGLDRASVPFTYYPDSKYVANASGTTAFDSVEASKAFTPPERSVAESGVETFTDSQTGAEIVGKRSRWPLNPPIFTFMPPIGRLAVPVGNSADGTKISRESTRLTNGKIADLVFVLLEPDAITKLETSRQVAGEMIVYNADQSGQYSGTLSNAFTNPAVAQNIDALLDAKPVAPKKDSAAKPAKTSKAKKARGSDRASVAPAPRVIGYDDDGSSSELQSTYQVGNTNSTTSASSNGAYDPYSDI